MFELMQALTSDFFLNWLPDLIGCMGTIIILITYAFLQIGRLESNSFIYSLLNLIGAFLILISLFFSWNVAAVFMEGAWIFISFYGMFRALRPYKAAHHPPLDLSKQKV